MPNCILQRPVKRSRAAACLPSASAGSAGAQPLPSVIVGDIGGTNCRLSLWEVQPGGSSRAELFHKVYPTKDYDDFELVLRTFLQEDAARKLKPQAAALAVAGAVADNVCHMTNLSWTVDGASISKVFGVKTRVLNDFEAVGYGIPALAPEDLVVINAGPAHQDGHHHPKVVMGPGTGLGAAQLIWDAQAASYKVAPGEGAHGSFAPRGWKQQALSRWVEYTHGHTEIEEVACGGGLELIYKFLLTDETFNRPDLLPGTPKSAPDITKSALDGSDVIASEAVDLFIAIIGAEAGHMALRVLAHGGVYIAGGIFPLLLERVKQGGFLEAFINPKGRAPFVRLLQSMPVYIVTNTKVGLIGSREVAVNLLDAAAA